MAAIANDIDRILQAAPTRTTNLASARVRLTQSAYAFHVTAAGANDPASITVTADLTDLEGTISFSASGGTLTSVTANSAALTYANMSAVPAAITATVISNGQTYSDTCYITKVLDGAQGPAGVPTYTWIKYATSAAGAGLSDSPDGMTYIGLAYNKSTATESTVATDYAWSLIKGDQGPQGNQGVQGPTGPTGAATYTWVKYSDNADGTGLYDTPTAATLYIGIAVNKSVQAESTVNTDYVWSKFRGDQGVQGPVGPNGAPTYTWIKYADSAAGAGLTDDPAGKLYIGFAYNKSTATESTTASDYSWSLIKGDQGPQGVQGPVGPNGAPTYTWIKYADVADGTGLYDTPTASTLYIGIAPNKTTATESTVKTDYVWSKFKGDQGVQGLQGNQGSTGPRGAGQYYATGSAWSDATADAATPGTNIADDLVTISNGSTYALTKRWDGAAWVNIGQVIDGNLLVTGSVNAAKVNTNGLIVRALDGTPLVGIGVPLHPSLAAPNTLNSEQTLAALGQKTFRVVARGGAAGANAPVDPGLYIDGTLVHGVVRSYTMVRIRRSDGVIVFNRNYDVYGEGALTSGNWAGQLAVDLDASTSGDVVVVYTYDEPRTRRFDGGLAAAMYRCGASRAMFGSPDFKTSSAYILVGIPGCGEGGGAEAYQGTIDGDPNAWCDVGFSLAKSVVTGITGASSVGNLVNVGLIDARDRVATAQQTASDAANAIPGINNAIAAAQADADAAAEAAAAAAAAAAAKLNKNAADTLAGRVALQANGAIVAGNLAFDANGNRTSGTGSAMNQKGFVHYGPDGTAAVVINAAGVAVKGDVSGSTGTFGAVAIGSTCSFGQTAYDTGNGGWIQGGATPKFSMRSANGKYLRIDVAAGIYQMHGLSITGSAIDSPTITTGFALNLTGDGAAAGPVNSTVGVLFEIAPTGYTGALSTAWSFTRTSGALPSAQIYITEDSDGLGATFSCTSATNASGTINITGSCRVRHSGGLSHEVSLPISFTFGGAV